MKPNMNTQPLWLREFPEFPPGDMPSAIPAGFEDTSYRNDTAPSFTHHAYGLRLWIDCADPAAREYPERPRYLLEALDTGPGGLDDWEPCSSVELANTDAWEVITAMLEPDALCERLYALADIRQTMAQHHDNRAKAAVLMTEAAQWEERGHRVVNDATDAAESEIPEHLR